MDELLAEYGGRYSIGTENVETIVTKIRIFNYVNILNNVNYKILYSCQLQTINIDVIAVTENTKNLICAFLQCSSNIYTYLSFVDKQRVKRLFQRFLWKSNLLKETFDEHKFNRTDFNLDTVQSYLIETEKGNLEQKYLHLLSIIFDVDILLLLPNNTTSPVLFIGDTTHKNHCICIIQINNIYLPVKINNQFLINHSIINLFNHEFLTGNDLKNKLNLHKIELLESENVEDNIQEIIDRQNLEPDLDEIFSIDDELSREYYKMIEELRSLD